MKMMPAHPEQLRKTIMAPRSFDDAYEPRSRVFPSYFSFFLGASPFPLRLRSMRSTRLCTFSLSRFFSLHLARRVA